MSVDYSNLWKILLDKKINKSQLKDAAHISTNAVAKLGRNENVSLDTLEKICAILDCSIGEILEFKTFDTADVVKDDLANKGKAGTFSLNKGEPIHRWYSYVEGYSSCLIVSELENLVQSGKKIRTIYDPFSGTGTTNLVASMNGIESFYSESNPFMQSVIDTKINSVRSFNARYSTRALQHYMSVIQNSKMDTYESWDGFERFYDQPQLSHLLSIKSLISTETDPVIYSLLMLALSSIAVKTSKMVRRGDLRYATEKEYRPEDVIQAYVSKLAEIIQDIDIFGCNVLCGVTKVSDDSRANCFEDTFDCVITSPPYLNGTNYIRNTKLELKLNDFVRTEADLPAFHSKGIVAGINNVSKRSGERPILPEVEPYYGSLVESAYDSRIPKMVAGYFYDMDQVFARLQKSMRNSGHFIMDIGDSQFGGIHIPTHEILSALCKNHGFSLYSEDVLRERKSKNGMVLSQRLLRFRLEK